MASQTTLSGIVVALQAFYGRPKRPKASDPLGMILWENVLYLGNDEKREKAFDLLRKRVGLSAERILAAPENVLREICKTGGILPDVQVQKLRRIAQIVLDQFGGDLRKALGKQTIPQMKKSLKQFPAIADTGAEKILLFWGKRPVLALESNGLRVLRRVGFGQELKTYGATYRSVQEALKGQFPEDCAWLVRAHQLLRRHGQELCKRTQPLCEQCPLARSCRYYLTQMAG